MDYKINHNNSVGLSAKTNPAVIITQTFEDITLPPPPRDPNGDIILPAFGSVYPLEFAVLNVWDTSLYQPIVKLIHYFSDEAFSIGPSLISAYYNGADFPVRNYSIIYPPVSGGFTGIPVNPIEHRTDANYMGLIINKNLPFIPTAGMADLAQRFFSGNLINTNRVNWAGPAFLHGIYVLKSSNKGIPLYGLQVVLYSYIVRFMW